MYKVACPLSCETLLAPYLLKHTMPVSRIRDESTHGRRWHSRRGQWSIGGYTVGYNVAQLQSGKGSVMCFLFVLSLKWCGATRHKIVLEQEWMHWAVRGRAMTRHCGAGDTPSHLLCRSPWLRGPTPSLPGLLWASGTLFPKQWCPQSLPSGGAAWLGTAQVVVEGSQAAHPTLTLPSHITRVKQR